MAYFDGIKVGDKVYTVGNSNGIEVTHVGEDGCFGAGAYYYNKNGELDSMESIGQVAFWQPVKIEAPPKPERWEKRMATADNIFADEDYPCLAALIDNPDKYRNIQISWEEKV